MTDRTPARPLPTGSANVTLGRLLHRARNGNAEERRAAQAELERRRAAGQSGGAA